MGLGSFQQKEPKNPGAHKIGAANSGPRIAGGKIMDVRLFLIWGLLPEHEAFLIWGLLPENRVRDLGGEQKGASHEKHFLRSAWGGFKKA